MKPVLFWAAFIFGMVVGAAITAPRAQDYVIVSGLAKHLDGKQHCNSTTTGLGYEHSQSENWRSQIGFYRNSGCKWSAYLGEAWLPLKLGNWRGGVIAGLVTGYGSPVLPAGGAVISYEPKESLGFNLIYIPPAGESGSGVLWLQARLPWG